MFEKINWNITKITKISENKEEIERTIWDTIERFKYGDHTTIGKGKTAKVFILEKYPEICLKIISNKTISTNCSHREMKFLDLASRHNLPVPKPICSIETNSENDYLFLETIRGFSLKDLINMDLSDDLPKLFDFDKFFVELRVIIERMHKQKIYHRDLHWGNVLVDNSGQPVIIDFGDATVNYFSSENPYREINAKGEMILFPSDENMLEQLYKQVSTYLRKKGFLKTKKEGVK